MVTVIYREGDSFNVSEIDEFSVSVCLNEQKLTVNHQQTDSQDATSVSVEHFPNNTTIVTYSDYDGECRNWIGPTNQFVSN